VQPDIPPVLLVVHPGSLGDVLLSLGALRALRIAWPTHELTLVARGEVAGLLRACGEVHQALPIEGATLAQLLAGPDALPPGLAARLRRCTAAVCWMNDQKGALRTTLRRSGVGQVIVQSPHSLALHAVHAADCYLESLRPWGLRPADRPPVLQIPRPAHLGPDLTDAEILAVHPGSGSPAKCYDVRRLALAIASLTGKGARTFLILGGPADDTQIAELQRHLAGVKPSMILNRDLMAVAAALGKAHVFVGHDSGVTHLAAALGLPTIALFGPTNPSRWAPRGPRVIILRGAPCACLGWQQVKSCRLRSCLDIPVEQIVTAVEGCLAARRAPEPRLPWSEKVC
jgi:ADP-heptose:LPS heptosyltransferase